MAPSVGGRRLGSVEVGTSPRSKARWRFNGSFIQSEQMFDLTLSIVGRCLLLGCSKRLRGKSCSSRLLFGYRPATALSDPKRKQVLKSKEGFEIQSIRIARLQVGLHDIIRLA